VAGRREQGVLSCSQAVQAVGRVWSAGMCSAGREGHSRGGQHTYTVWLEKSLKGFSACPFHINKPAAWTAPGAQ
jgi:hypothetical protein